MSNQRKWVITTLALIAWLICLVLLTQSTVPFGCIFLASAAFGALLAAIHAP